MARERLVTDEEWIAQVRAGIERRIGPNKRIVEFECKPGCMPHVLKIEERKEK